MRHSLLAEPKGAPWLVATGTLTNVALLFATFPEVVGHIRGLSVMGGAIGNGFTDAPMGNVIREGNWFGNQTGWAEFNIYVSDSFSLLHFPYIEYISQLVWHILEKPYGMSTSLLHMPLITPAGLRPIILLTQRADGPCSLVFQKHHVSFVLKNSMIGRLPSDPIFDAKVLTETNDSAIPKLPRLSSQTPSLRQRQH